MKILAAADLHMTAAVPVNRTDDYETTVLEKFDQILHLARQHNAVLTISGDLFDTSKMSKVPYQLTNRILQMIRLSKVRILACHGQHDMVYHNANLQPSPYYTLLVGGGIEIPGPMGIIIENIRFYGAGWGQEIAMPMQKDPYLTDVLLLHRTITPGDPPFFLKDATPSLTALKNLYNYDLILSGDYHDGFVSELDDRFLVNPGPMMRNNIAAREYRPRVYLIDTWTADIQPQFLTVRDDVWDDERLEKQRQHDISINTEGLLDAMVRKNDRPDYFKILSSLLDETKNPVLTTMVNQIITTARKELEGV